MTAEASGGFSRNLRGGVIEAARAMAEAAGACPSWPCGGCTDARSGGGAALDHGGFLGGVDVGDELIDTLVGKARGSHEGDHLEGHGRGLDGGLGARLVALLVEVEPGFGARGEAGLDLVLGHVAGQNDAVGVVRDGSVGEGHRSCCGNRRYGGSGVQTGEHLRNAFRGKRKTCFFSGSARRRREETRFGMFGRTWGVSRGTRSPSRTLVN